MNLKILAVLLFLMNWSLGAMSQENLIKVQSNNTTLKEVLKEIEKQVDYTFLYNDVKIDVNQLVNAQVESSDLNKVLSAILDGTNINYVIKGKQIVLSNLEIAAVQGTTSKEKKVVSGIVTMETGETIPGVNIVVKGTNFGVTTDFDGKFSIEVSDDAILSFSYIGFDKQDVPVKGRTDFNIVLKESYESLEQVVVIGYGTVKKSDLTGSVSSVRGKDLVKSSGSSAENALMGKVPGLQVIPSSGSPGSVPVIRLRGVGTLNNSSPIFVVDGVILDDISFLNAADIESMEVLKDASATAIYGSRGANGVIIVTTKLGVVGDGQKIEVSYNYSTQYLPHKIDLLNGQEFGAVVNEINPGTFNNLAKVKNTDWQSLIFNEFAPMHNAQISLSGSVANKYEYYIGLGYYNQEGLITKSGYERYSIKLNQKYFISKKVRIGSIWTISPDKRRPGADVVAQANRAWPTDAPYNDDGSFAEVTGAGNPLASIEYQNGYDKRIRAVGSFYGEADILKSLKFKTSLGFDLSNTQSKSFTPSFFVSPLQQNVTSDLNVSASNSLSWLWENTLTWDYTHGDHYVNVLGGYTMQKSKWEIVGGSVENLIGDDESLWYLNAGETDTQKTYSEGGIYSMISYLFRTNYNYRKKYLLTFSLRGDGSSKFSKTNMFGYFPSVAVGWNIANEGFFPKKGLISNMKIRASWGMTGNEKIPAEARFSLVANQQNVVFGINEILVSGATLGNTANPDLKWESTAQSNVGFELGILEGKYIMEVDYFKKTTSDILVYLPTLAYFGNGANVEVVYNAATVENSGIEFALNTKNSIGKNWTIDVNANGAYIKNEVKSLGANSDSDSFIQGGSLGNGQMVTRTEVGQPIGSFYGYEVLGVFQTQEELDNSAIIAGQEPGDLKYADLNGDGIIDAEDRTYIGSPIPDFMFGFGATLGFKRLFLSVDFYGQYGNEVYNGKNAVRPDLYNFEGRVRDRWTGAGTSNTEPRATSGGANYEPSEYFIEDGSFLRLRTVTLGYEFSDELLKKIGFKKADIYLRGSNIFTISKFSGYSPEFGSSSVFSSGIDFGTYPVSAVLSCGVNLTF